MYDRKLESLDLNLLRVLDMVMREGSFTSAAARLGQTQPAISHAVARLRQHLGDPLFCRTSSGLQPTVYAQQLSQSITTAFDALRAGVASISAFDPPTSTRTFTIVTTDIAEAYLFPELISHLRSAAPQICVRVLPAMRSGYRALLETEDADLAIGRLPENHVDFQRQHLFDVGVACLVRRDHPTIGAGPLDIEDFMAASHVSVSEPAQAEMLIKRALGKRADHRKIALQLTHYGAVPMIVAASDLIAAIPLTISAASLKAQNLCALPLPFAVPKMEVMQFWHQRSHHDPGHRWLRNTIAALFMGRMNDANLVS